MYKYYVDRIVHQRAAGEPQEEDNQEFDLFQGNIIVVDLATTNGQTEDFEGRSWLDAQVRNQAPLGWDLEWQPDRKDSDNPIALMQFADNNTALLLRTHQTREWLPSSVIRVLQSETCLKVSCGWDGPDKHKFQNTFNFLPSGISDLTDLVKKKAVPCSCGLKSLTEHFGLKMKKDAKMRRWNWASPGALAREQAQYAADDAYFTLILYEKLRSLPDPVIPPEEQRERDNVDAGILQMKDGWEEQGVVRRHDGLYCSLCEKGPMTVPMVVDRHLEGNKHRAKTAAKKGLGASPTGEIKELPDEYTMQGIIVGDGVNGAKVGEFKCTLCNAGPWTMMVHIDQHIQSKKHQKVVAPQTEPDPAKAAEPQKDPFEDVLWNMPDYVERDGANMVCTLCKSKASTAVQIYLHLGGSKHTKKCRADQYPEVFFMKERDRLEVLTTGAPVVRRGFKAPKRGTSGSKVASTKASENGANEDSSAQLQNGVSQEGSPVEGLQDNQESAAQPQGGADQERPLAEGWQEFLDPVSGCKYYFNPTTKVSQWERPEAPLAPEPRPEVLMPESRTQSRLPPGWREVQSQDGTYYADVETQVSTWDPPAAYVEHDWKRLVDPSGRAFWRCTELIVCFYETDEKWQRLMTHDKQLYWSNQEMGIRFFEPPLF